MKCLVRDLDLCRQVPLELRVAEVRATRTTVAPRVAGVPLRGVEGSTREVIDEHPVHPRRRAAPTRQVIGCVSSSKLSGSGYRERSEHRESEQRHSERENPSRHAYLDVQLRITR